MTMATIALKRSTTKVRSCYAFCKSCASVPITSLNQTDHMASSTRGEDVPNLLPLVTREDKIGLS